jgi:hypothetical protein
MESRVESIGRKETYGSWNAFSLDGRLISTCATYSAGTVTLNHSSFGRPSAMLEMAVQATVDGAVGRRLW